MAVWAPCGLLGFAQHKEFLAAFNILNLHCSVCLLDCNGRSQRREGGILECFASSLDGFCFRALQNLICDEHRGHRNRGILGIEGDLSVG